MCLMIHFFMYKTEKKIVFQTFFKINSYFFPTGTPTASKLNDGIPVMLV